MWPCLGEQIPRLKVPAEPADKGRNSFSGGKEIGMETVGTLLSLIVIAVVVWKVRQTAFWKNYGQKAVSSAVSSGKASLKDYQEKAAAEKARKATPEYRISELQKKIPQLQQDVKTLTGIAPWSRSARTSQERLSLAQIKQQEIMILQAELNRLMQQA